MPSGPLTEALSRPLYYLDPTWHSLGRKPTWRPTVGNLQPTLSTYMAQLVVARNLRARNLRVARNPAMIVLQVVLQVVA